jgi:hypothetical protein
MCKSSNLELTFCLSLRSFTKLRALGIAFQVNHRNVNSFNGIHQIAIVIQLEATQLTIEIIINRILSFAL